MIEKVKINKIYSNPVNPRTIKEHKFKKLVNSIKEFPEMLKLRNIHIYTKHIVCIVAMAKCILVMAMLIMKNG